MISVCLGVGDGAKTLSGRATVAWLPHWLPCYAAVAHTCRFSCEYRSKYRMYGPVVTEGSLKVITRMQNSSLNSPKFKVRRGLRRISIVSFHCYFTFIMALVLYLRFIKVFTARLSSQLLRASAKREASFY